MILFYRLLRALRRLGRQNEEDPGDFATPSDLEQCYHLLLGREPSLDDLRFYLPVVRRGISRHALVDGFLASQEFRARFHAQPTYVETEHGFGIFLDPYDIDISPAIVDNGDYEPDVRLALTRELRPGSVFLDIGANVGWFTLLASGIVAPGRVIAIEPNRGNVQLLYASLQSNGLDNIFVYPYAATDSFRLLRLANVRSNGVVREDFPDAWDENYVHGVALDTILASEPAIDVVKMDIEGHEPFALRGMRALMAKHRPVLITEFHPKCMVDFFGADPVAYLTEIHDLGYRTAVIQPDGTESPALTPTQTMAAWKEHNEQLELTDEAHVNLLCRPTQPRNHP